MRNEAGVGEAGHCCLMDWGEAEGGGWGVLQVGGQARRTCDWNPLRWHFKIVNSQDMGVKYITKTLLLFEEESLLQVGRQKEEKGEKIW